MEVWSLIQTQWVFGAMGGRVGLNYPGVRAAVEAMGIGWTEDVLRAIQMIEILEINHAAEQEKKRDAVKQSIGGEWKAIGQGSRV